jgi:hypothetical protein
MYFIGDGKPAKMIAKVGGKRPYALKADPKSPFRLGS